MQNNNAPRQIKALLVRLHVIQHDDGKNPEEQYVRNVLSRIATLFLIFRYQMRPRDHANSISLFRGRPRLIVHRG